MKQADVFVDRFEADQNIMYTNAGQSEGFEVEDEEVLVSSPEKTKALDLFREIIRHTSSRVTMGGPRQFGDLAEHIL